MLRRSFNWLSYYYGEITEYYNKDVGVYTNNDER